MNSPQNVPVEKKGNTSNSPKKSLLKVKFSNPPVTKCHSAAAEENTDFFTILFENLFCCSQTYFPADVTEPDMGPIFDPNKARDTCKPAKQVSFAKLSKPFQSKSLETSLETNATMFSNDGCVVLSDFEFDMPDDLNSVLSPITVAESNCTSTTASIQSMSSFDMEDSSFCSMHAHYDSDNEMYDDPPPIKLAHVFSSPHLFHEVEYADELVAEVDKENDPAYESSTEDIMERQRGVSEFREAITKLREISNDIDMRLKHRCHNDVPERRQVGAPSA